MKRHLLSLVCVLFFTVGFTQSAKLPAQTIRDFAVNFYYEHHFEKNYNIRALAQLAGTRLGYGYVDIEVAVEQMEKNARFREEVYKLIYAYCKCNQEMLSLQLMSIGMKAGEAKTLATYILTKYRNYVDNDNVQGSKEEEKEPEQEHHYEAVQEEAKFIGGGEAYQKYLAENLHFPDSVYRDNIEGRVVVQFIIDKDGSVKEVKVVEGGDIGYGIPEEAVRVIASMPKWSPALLRDGTPVKAYRKQPLTFTAPEDKQEEKDVKQNSNVPKAIFSQRGKKQ